MTDNGLSDKDQRELAAMKSSGQGWHYSWVFGIMYGNVPVGIIVAVVLAILWGIAQC